MLHYFDIFVPIYLAALLGLQMPADMQTVETQKRTMKYEKK